MDWSYLGLIKAHNDFEVLNDGSVDQIAMERTYTITGETLNYYCGGENVDAKEMTAVIDYGGGIGRFTITWSVSTISEAWILLPRIMIRGYAM